MAGGLQRRAARLIRIVGIVVATPLILFIPVWLVMFPYFLVWLALQVWLALR